MFGTSVVYSDAFVAISVFLAQKASLSPMYFDEKDIGTGVAFRDRVATMRDGTGTPTVVVVFQGIP
jgi:hypothetical protein